jgi:hypothetical protein
VEKKVWGRLGVLHIFGREDPANEARQQACVPKGEVHLGPVAV